MKQALLIIDVQQAMCVGDYAAFDIERVIQRINSVSARARAGGVAVIVIQHEEDEGPMKHGTQGWQLGAGLVTQPSDLFVRKKTPDSFNQTNLHALLQERGVTDLIVCGLQTEYCVDSTIRRALSLGYPVELVSDGHTTLDNGVLKAEQIMAHHNTTLANIMSFGKRVVLRSAQELSVAA